MQPLGLVDEALPADFVPKEPYLSRAFLELEKRNLWPKSWLMAGREEEVAKPGHFVTLEIADESIIVVRDRELKLRAFYNVCQHRGRRLVDGCGVTAKIFCKYHGWRWKLDGTIDKVMDREDWAGALEDDRIALKAVHVDTWGGFVFVNMLPDPEPLAEFLAPFVKHWGNHKTETMRYGWFRSVKVPCNWKVALDVFIEGYHGQTAHRQANLLGGHIAFDCEVFGRHSVFRDRFQRVIGDPHIATADFDGYDERDIAATKLQGIPAKAAAYIEMMHRDLESMISTRGVEAARRLNDLPPDTSYLDTMMAYGAYVDEYAKRDGVIWHQLSHEDIAFLGVDWAMFPNIALLPTPDGLLGYRARPDGDDPDSGWLDIFSLERYAPGKEPPFRRETYHDWHDRDWPRIFPQDFENLEDIQKGMKSAGFEGGLCNPASERTVSNFHRAIREQVLGRAA